MLSGIRMRLGLVAVSTTPKNIVVEGVSTYVLMKDIYRIWGSSVFAKWMFTSVRSSELKMRHFFGLDFLYMCQQIHDDPQSRTPRRVMRKLIEELKTNTWLGQVDIQEKSICDISGIDKIVPFPLKPYQREFPEIFGKVVPAYNLNGYMLDAGAGSGKTVTDMIVGECLGADHVVILCPKNSINTVWEATIRDILLHKRTYWLSTDTRPPSLDDHYYVVHYESLDTILDFFKANARELKNVFAVLDESHNFNRLASDRTKLWIEFCQLKSVVYNLWASGTPILALGTECIPFLRCVDPLFDSDCEERFRKIYGASAKRGLDILRNRIGHLKYHVPKQDVVKTKVTEHQVKVKFPGCEQYTLSAIKVVMTKFMAERGAYYEKNKDLYHGQYKAGVKLFQATLRGDQEKREFNQYVASIKLISSGFDPKTMAAEAQFCNRYELKTILPVLPALMRADFKSARSVVKYVKLKILGETLGTVLGGARTRCHVEMAEHIDFETLIDQAEKKTLIFTSYVEVVDTVAYRLDKEGYETAKVYGATNKDLASIVSAFYKDPDVNPLAATFQSLSTAVPLTAANRIIMINQPWRSGIREQTIARAARLGQDMDVDVFDCVLDTGAEPNISTRSQDIMTWSAEMAAAILGIKNVDPDTLALESEQPEAAWMALLEDEDASLEADAMTETDNLPSYLFHGSAYKQGELMPGFQRSGNLVKWDNTEDNTWLYSTSKREDAIMLGISSAIEKQYKLDRYHYDQKRRMLEITISEPITQRDIEGLQVYLYTIRADAADGWMANYNPANGIDDEFKTQRTVEKGLIKTEVVDVAAALRHLTVKIIGT